MEAVKIQHRPIWAWVIILIASSYFFYEFIQMNMVGSLADSFESTFHLTSFQLSLIACFYFLSDSILLYPAGALLDYFSSKTIMMIGMIMCVLGTYLITFATNSWFLVGARFLAGTASAFCLLSILRLAAQWFPAKRLGLVSGVIVAIGMLGGAFAQQPLSLMISRVNWRWALHIVGLMGIFFLILIFFFVKDAPMRHRHAALQTDDGIKTQGWLEVLLKVIKNKNNWLAGLYTSTMNLPIMILAGLFGTQLVQQETGATELHASWASTMIFIGTIFGSLVFGLASDGFKSRKQPMLWAAVLSIIEIVYIIYTPHLSANAYILLFFIMGFITSAQILGYPVIREVNPGVMVGAALGFISVLIMVLPTFLQPLTGWLLQKDWHSVYVDGGVPFYTVIEYNRIFWVIACGFVVSILCVFFLPETYGRTGERE